MDPNAATCGDYLEKLFQIPYWVRPMTGEASGSFIRGIAARSMQAANESGSWDSVVLDAAKGGSDRQTESVEISRRPAKQPGDKGGQSDESDNTSLREKSSAGANAGLGEAPVSVEENTETPRKVFGDVRALTLSKGEAEAMEKLAPYLGGSPRRGKRFVNVYRLIKSSLDSKALSKLGADDPTPAWALLAQLAIATGAPALAARYFEKLQTARTLSLLRKDLENDGILAASPQARDLLGALGTLSKVPGWEPDEAASVERLKEYAEVAGRYSFAARR